MLRESNAHSYCVMKCKGLQEIVVGELTVFAQQYLKLNIKECSQSDMNVAMPWTDSSPLRIVSRMRKKES